MANVYTNNLSGRDIFYLKNHSDSTKTFSETDIINMREFLIDNIFVMFDGRVFQQTVGIPMGTNCAPPLADLFLNSFEADFIQRLLDFVDCIYPIELEIKDTTDTDTSASYIDPQLKIDNEVRLKTVLYDKRDDANFPIVNFPFVCSNIPAAPEYGEYISHLIQCNLIFIFVNNKHIHISF